MKTRSFSAGVLAATLTLSLAGSAWAAHRNDAEQAIAEAKAVQTQATAAGVNTGETAKLIEEAQGLLTSRQYTKAIELAKQAMSEDRFAMTRAGGGSGSAAAAEAEKAIAAAEASRKKAAAVGGEWRDVANTITQAGELAKTGDFSGAIKLANQAERQGELGYIQAMAEKNATFPSYMLPKKN
jgi:hypothetical protein